MQRLGKSRKSRRIRMLVTLLVLFALVWLLGLLAAFPVKESVVSATGHGAAQTLGANAASDSKNEDSSSSGKDGSNNNNNNNNNNNSSNNSHKSGAKYNEVTSSNDKASGGQLQSALFAPVQYAEGAFYDEASHVLGTSNFPIANQYQRQPYVSNGYLGSRVPSVGHGFAYDTLTPEGAPDDISNGWPLFNPRYAGAFVAGFFDLQPSTNGTNFPWLLQYGGESVVAAVPQWTTLMLAANGSHLDPQHPSGVSSYLQNLSMADGTVRTAYEWRALNVHYDVWAHRTEPSLGIVRVSVTSGADSPVQLQVVDLLDFATAQRCELDHVGVDNDAVYMMYRPQGAEAYGATYSIVEVEEAYNETNVDKNTNAKGNDAKGEGNNKIKRDVSQSGIGAGIGAHVSTDGDKDDNKSETKIESTFCVFANSYAQSNQSVSHTVSLTLLPGQSIILTKYVGVVSSDIDPDLTLADAVLERARQVARTHAGNYDTARSSHVSAWKDLHRAPAFPDDPLLSLAARASVFHLAANTRENATGLTAALGVTGLSSDSYGGMVFWDTDLWILHGLLPFHPLHAKSLVNYRMHTRKQALDNIHSPLAPHDGFSGAVYPWTSGRYGNCTGTGPCFDYEYHINAAVAMAAWQVYLSGAGDETYLLEVTRPLVRDAARFLSSYAVYNGSLQMYTTSNLTDPDEYANHIDNGAYTNAAILATTRWALSIARHLADNDTDLYESVPGNVFLPRSSHDLLVVLEYSGMNSSVEIKQADVVMLTYPLDNELITEREALANLDYYAAKQLSVGPAMTYPIFSAVANAVLQTGCAALSYLQKAVQPFLRGPFAQFSEQNFDTFRDNGGTHPAFPFMTAHGGLLQAVVSGILGLRFDFRAESGRIERFLRLDPVFSPKLPNGVFFDTIYYMNRTLSMNLTEDGLTVRDLGPALFSPLVTNGTAISIVSGTGSAEKSFELSNGGEVVIPVRRTQPLYADSLTECGKALFTNITASAYGDIADLMNDGANATHWQAQTANVTKILVDLKAPSELTHAVFNWGDRPPRHLLVLAMNSSEYSLTEEVLANVDFGNSLYEKYSYASRGRLVAQDALFTQIYSTDVDISEPFDAVEALKVVVPTRFNVTTFDLTANYEPRFVLVEFDGVHDDQDVGAKICEAVFF